MRGVATCVEAKGPPVDGGARSARSWAGAGQVVAHGPRGGERRSRLGVQRGVANANAGGRATDMSQNAKPISAMPMLTTSRTVV